MFGAVRRYQRNQRLYGILNDHRNYSDPTPIENKRLIVSIDGRSMDTELRPNELCFLNPQDIGYAVVNDREKGVCLLIDRFEKDGEPEYLPFTDGSVTLRTESKNKVQIITFKIEDAEISSDGIIY